MIKTTCRLTIAEYHDRKNQLREKENIKSTCCLIIIFCLTSSALFIYLFCFVEDVCLKFVSVRTSFDGFVKCK